MQVLCEVVCTVQVVSTREHNSLNSVQWASTNYFATVQLACNKGVTSFQVIYEVVCKKCGSNVEQFQADGGSHRGEKHTGT